MSFTAFLLIVASAGLHATWNLVAKKNRMSLPFYMIIASSCMLVWLHVQFWTPVAVSALSWKFWMTVFASVAADVLYCCGLVLSYRRMEMATAYPVMRALPIILTALATGLFGWGKPLTGISLVGFFIVFTGALLIPLNRLADFRPSQYWNWNMFYILMVACGTTGYTILDSRAQEVLAGCAEGVAAPIRSLTYYSIRGVALCTTLGLITCFVPSCRCEFRNLIAGGQFKAGILAGMLAALSYPLVLCAMNYVTNVSYVQVFRQLGLPIGMGLGVLFLKEHCPRIKVVGVILILGGLAVSVMR